MKTIIAAIALLAATVPALAQTQLDPRTQEYRMWSAERMIDRLTIRLCKLSTACNYARLSQACQESVASLYPQFKTIREVAAGGDDVKWAKVIVFVHTLEKDTEPSLNALDAFEHK